LYDIFKNTIILEDLGLLQPLSDVTDIRFCGVM